jgi:hypothetical protein
MAAKAAIHAFPQKQKASGRFFKKKLRKKFLLLVPVALPQPVPPGQKFFGCFFSNK